MLMTVFFEDILHQSFKVQKSIFMKYVRLYHRYNIRLYHRYMLYHILYVGTVYTAAVYRAVYVLVHSEEGYYLIWKAKPLFKLTKGRTMNYCDIIIH